MTPRAREIWEAVEEIETEMAALRQVRPGVYELDDRGRWRIDDSLRTIRDLARTLVVTAPATES